MAQKTETTKDPIANVEDALTKSEIFIEKNRNVLLGVVGGIIVVVGGYFAYKQYVVKPREVEAQSAIFRAERFFEKDSFNLALNGKDKAEGFLSIIENYGGTQTGNLAHYYAGVCYLNLGKYQEALDQMDEFDADDIMLASMALGVKGDASMELGKVDEAIEYYVKAAGKNENSFTTPMFLMKAALAYEGKGEYSKALEAYNKIRTEVFQSAEGREAEKYIARAELMLQQKGGK
jgi:tetratricopeptide (TPR) repeat protein